MSLRKNGSNGSANGNSNPSGIMGTSSSASPTALVGTPGGASSVSEQRPPVVKSVIVRAGSASMVGNYLLLC